MPENLAEPISGTPTVGERLSVLAAGHMFSAPLAGIQGCAATAAWSLSPGYWVTRRAGGMFTAASVIDPVVNDAFTSVLHMRAHLRALARNGLLLRSAVVLASRTKGPCRSAAS
ncbi:hypothetical protein AB0N79_39795 [Streptomyces microflavus]|uniref:hypothetical protein n=1 Tax=Streptomyces microflavus TaxID=1919 RepID=UPI0034349107